MSSQAHIFYSGRVQGVGFRYTVLRYAHSLKLKGWVSNLSDGRVEMVVEGSAEQIEELCGEVEKYFTGYIKNKNFTITNSEEVFTDFQIRH